MINNQTDLNYSEKLKQTYTEYILNVQNDTYLENLTVLFQTPITPGPYSFKSLFWLPACPESVFLRSIKVFNFAAVFWFPHKSTMVSRHSHNLKISFKDFLLSMSVTGIMYISIFFSMEQQWKRGITLQHTGKWTHLTYHNM